MNAKMLNGGCVFKIVTTGRTKNCLILEMNELPGCLHWPYSACVRSSQLRRALSVGIREDPHGHSGTRPGREARAASPDIALRSSTALKHTKGK